MPELTAESSRLPNSGEASVRPAKREAGVLAACGVLLMVLLVHHPLLWIDHVLWDEVSLEKMAKSGDLSGKAASLAAQGLGSSYPFYWIFSGFTDPSRVLRWASLVSLGTIALVIFRVLRVRASQSPGVAAVSTSIFAAYPACQMYANAGIAIYVVHIALFFLAGEFYLSGWRQDARRRWLWVVASGLWTISFTMQPLLVYFYAFFAALACCRPWPEWRDFWREAPHRDAVARIHAILGLLPVTYYFAQKQLFPLHPYFVGWYSRPRWEVSTFLINMRVAADAVFLAPLRQLLQLPLATLIGAAALGLIIFLGRRAVRPHVPTPSRPPVSRKRLAMAGLILLAGGLFPFVITGKPPTPEGPQTRYAILVAPSVAILFASLATTKFGMHRRERWIGALGATSGAILIGGFAMLHFRNYVNWQAAAVKDHALVAALRSVAPPERVSFFLISGRNLEQNYTRQHYDWSYLLHSAWGGYHRTAEMADRLGPVNRHYYTPIGLSREKVADFAEWMGYGHPGPPDDWCRIDVQTAPAFDFGGMPLDAVFQDLCFRAAGRTTERETWLRSFITEIRVSPPFPFRYSATQLTAQHLVQPGRSGWQPASRGLWAALQPSGAQLHVHDSIRGGFSILPLGPRGFSLRCDALPAPASPAVINIEVRLPTAAVPRMNNPYGIACEVGTLGDSERPRLYLVASDAEIEAVPARPGVFTVEAWTDTIPQRAWIVWAPTRVGAVAQIRDLLLPAPLSGKGGF